MLSQQMAAMNGGPPPRANPTRDMMGDVIFPAAASCTKCEAEETISLNMSRCARCKLARCVYALCSAEIRTDGVILIQVLQVRVSR